MLVTVLFGTKPPLSQFALRGLLREGVVFFPSPSRRLYINRWDMCYRNEGKSIYHNFFKTWQPKRLKREIQKFLEACALISFQFSPASWISPNLKSAFCVLITSNLVSLTIMSKFFLCYLAQNLGNWVLIILLIAQDSIKVKMMESKLH